jgi:2-polyprenyl-6-methoxyphenol hydroxylase-like FAD-dependent oxidoreductase
VGYLAGELRDGRTLIEAVADGWIYAAALPGQRTVAALTVSADSVPRNAGARQAFWQMAIARSRLVGPVLEGLSLIGPLHVVNSRASAAARVGGASWCVIGDARIAPDPLSGQGLLWALDDAATLANALLASRSDKIADELAARSRSSLSDHCRAAAMIYGMERRFADAPFWREAARVKP